MSSPVISVRNLGKKYRLGETIRHDTLRDKIADRRAMEFEFEVLESGHVLASNYHLG